MRRIHGLPGTTFSNPVERGKYKSEAHATMTMGELEPWIGLEIAGKYHQNVHRGVHAIPAQLWDRSVRRSPPALITDPQRFVIDFLPAETRRVGRNGFQINRIRYLGPIIGKALAADDACTCPPRSKRSIEGLCALPVQC
jgi:putative transposase